MIRVIRAGTQFVNGAEQPHFINPDYIVDVEPHGVEGCTISMYGRPLTLKVKETAEQIACLRVYARTANTGFVGIIEGKLKMVPVGDAWAAAMVAIDSAT